MFNCGGFRLKPLILEYAESLSAMVLVKLERCQDSFPKTLAANVSVEKSQQFMKAIAEDFEIRIRYLLALNTDATISEYVDEVAGIIYIKELNWRNKEGEFAYCIDPKSTGRGWIGKSISTLLKDAFNTLTSIVQKSNTVSVHIAINSGFCFAKTFLKEYARLVKEPLDTTLYLLKR